VLPRKWPSNPKNDREMKGLEGSNPPFSANESQVWGILRKSARVRAISDCAWTQITSLIPLGLVFRQLPSTTVPLVTRTLQSEQDQQFVPLRSAADTRTCAVGRLAGACHLSESRWGSIRAKELLFVQWILSSSAFYGSLAPDTLSVSRLAYSH
jgi:hypothetical protein